MKKCQKCNSPLEVDTRAKKHCSDACRKRVKYEKDRAWVSRNREKVVAYARAWYETNREVRLKVKRETYRKKAMARYKEGLE